eukprot:10474498-Alexandrium_andersonii.AAC.2
MAAPPGREGAPGARYVAFLASGLLKNVDATTISCSLHIASNKFLFREGSLKVAALGTPTPHLPAKRGCGPTTSSSPGRGWYILEFRSPKTRRGFALAKLSMTSD